MSHPGIPQRCLAMQNAGVASQLSDRLTELVRSAGIEDRGDVQWAMRILNRLEAESRGLAVAIQNGITPGEYQHRTGRQSATSQLALAMFREIRHECEAEHRAGEEWKDGGDDWPD